MDLLFSPTEFEFEYALPQPVFRWNEAVWADRR